MMPPFVQMGWTGLHVASSKSHYQVVQILKSAKASLNLKTNVSVGSGNSICDIIL